MRRAKNGGVGVAHPRHEAWSPSGREREGRQRTMAAATTPLPRTADAYPVRCRHWAKLAATYEERQGDAVKRSLRSAGRKTVLEAPRLPWREPLPKRC
jgi:hypothetical protein